MLFLHLLKLSYGFYSFCLFVKMVYHIDWFAVVIYISRITLCVFFCDTILSLSMLLRYIHVDVCICSSIIFIIILQSISYSTWIIWPFYAWWSFGSFKFGNVTNNSPMISFIYVSWGKCAYISFLSREILGLRECQNIFKIL